MIIGGRFNDSILELKLEELNSKLEDPSLIKDIKTYSQLCKEHSEISSILAEIKSDTSFVTLLQELFDSDMFDADEEKALNELLSKYKKYNLEKFFTQPTDGNNCFLEIHAGSGGTEAQDWTSILLRMYSRFAEAKGFKVDLVSTKDGDVAGLKNAILKVSGKNASGWLRTEAGIHRLVRISPFDSADRRHTSFAAVTVMPEINNDFQIEILDKDLRIDTFRASGSGGQNVNKVNSAVRITHIPTGIVVQSQSERSQHQNKEYCYGMLKAKLYAAKIAEQTKALEKQMDELPDNSWGNQIRSYVLHPYQMIKDLRTEVQTSDSKGVLDGDLEQFILPALALEN